MRTINLQISVTLDDEATTALVELARHVTNKVAGVDEAREARIRASQHANFGGKKPPEDQGLLIDTREAAKLLKLSAKTLYNMYTTGRMPAPIRIGKAVRWGYEELAAWVNDGCPSMEGWKHSPKKGG